MPDDYVTRCARCNQKLKHPHIFRGKSYGYVCVEKVKIEKQRKLGEFDVVPLVTGYQ